MLKVGQVHAAKGLRGGRAHLQHHQPGAGLEHPRRFPEARIEIREIPNAPAHHRAIKGGIRKGKLQRVGVDGRGARGLADSGLQHGQGKVSPENPATKPPLPRERSSEIECAGAEVEISALGRPLPVKHPEGCPAPAQIEPQTDDPVEPVIGRGNGAKHLPYILSLVGTAGDW